MSATIITMEDFNAAAQQAKQAAQFVRRPVTVTVHWSESSAWENEQVVAYVDFEKPPLPWPSNMLAVGISKPRSR